MALFWNFKTIYISVAQGKLDFKTVTKP